MSRQLGQVG